MPRFQILPTDPSCALSAIIVSDAADVLPAVQQLECPEADVLRDGDYSYSVRLSDNGAWCIFQRDTDERPKVIS